MKNTQKKNLPDVDENTLIYAVLHGKDTIARCAAVRRINEVHGTEALVKVMQQSDDRYIRKYVRRLATENERDKRK